MMSLEAIEAELQKRQQNPELQAIEAEIQKRASAQHPPPVYTTGDTPGGRVVRPDWTNIGGQVPSSTPEQEAQVSGTWDRIGANVQAGATGILELGSSLAKLADKMGMVPKGTAESAQKSYEEAEKIYQSGTYPETAVSKLAGAMVPGTAIASAAPIGAAASAGGALLKSAPTLGKYIGAGIAGTAQGALLGGLTNTPGQSPDDVFNEGSAATGAGLGALLGPAGQLISNYGKNVAAYQTGKEALKETGFKGPVLARDFGDEAIANVKSTWMDNLIDTGVRNEQLAAITPAIKNILGKIINVTEQQGAHRLGQVVRGVNNRLEKESSQKWDELFSSAKNQGISKIDTELTKSSTAQFLEEYGSHLSKNDRSILSTLSQAKQVDFNTLNKVKGSDIWRMSEKFGKAEGSVNEDISDGLKKIYWNMTDDIGNTLKNNSDLYGSWEQARAFTSGVKDIFNVKNNRKLMGAIGDINETTGQLKTFINSVVLPASGKSADYYNEALGSSYQKAASDLTFNKIFTNSFDTEAKGLNIPKFFEGIKEANASHLLDNNTVKALGGLEKYFNKIQTAQEVAQKSHTAHQFKNAVPYAKAASIGAGYATGGIPGAAGAAALVLGGPALLSFISKSSPVKNLLIGLSNIYGKNPKTTEYLTDLVGRKLNQVGVILSESPSGTTADIKKETK